MEMAEHDINGIPEKLNLLREAADDSDLTIGAYTIGYFRYHCLCLNEDAEMLDLAGALEGTLHALEEHGFTDDDIREVMGLERDDDADVLENIDDYGAEYASIDHGWVFSPNAMDFSVIPPQECSDALRSAFTEAQIGQAVHALDEGKGIHEAMDALRTPGKEQGVSLKGAAKEAREASEALAGGKAADEPAIEQNR